MNKPSMVSSKNVAKGSEIQSAQFEQYACDIALEGFELVKSIRQANKAKKGKK